jgi:hypothetical protein
VFAGEIGDEVRGGIDRPPIDRLHGLTLAAGRVTLPVTVSTA